MLKTNFLNAGLGDIGPGLFLGKKFRVNPDLVFACDFAPGVLPRDMITGQAMQTVKTGIHPDYDGVLHGENEPVIDRNGLLTYGPYTNLVQYSEDVTLGNKTIYGSPIVTAVDGGQNIAMTVANAYYIVLLGFATAGLTGTYTASFKARFPEGVTQRIVVADKDWTANTLSNISASSDIIMSGNNGTFVGTDKWEEYSISFSTTNGFFISLRPNTTGAFTWQYAHAQITATPYLMPYRKTESATVSVLQNYADADEGNKFQIMPDEIGSVYTGPGGTRNMGMPLVLDALDGSTAGNPELVTNGGFDSDTSWAAEGESTISSGVARILSTAGVLSQITQSSTFTVGKRYQVEFDVISTNGVNLASNEGIIWNTAKVGHVIQRVLPTGTSLVFKRASITDVTIDNISVKEISPAKGEMVVEWMPKFSPNIGAVGDNKNIITVGSDTLLGQKPSSPKLFAYDGTSYAAPSSFPWQSGELYTIRIVWGNTNFELLISDGVTTVLSETRAFDGSFDPESFLSFAFENIYPLYIKSIKIYKEPQSW